MTLPIPSDEMQGAPRRQGAAPASPQGSWGLAGGAGDPRLTNEDLTPVEHQNWGVYNYVAFWMTDVHSVAGYLTAGSLFALGLPGWQVLTALVLAVLISYGLSNLVAKPSQETGAPYPVVCRASFGVLGANIPAVLRGLNAVAWYGMQTYLASNALTLVLAKLVPPLVRYVEPSRGLLGLSPLGWASFATVWALQAAIFWHGMDFIKKFIDFCGPAVYLVMFALCGYLIHKAGWGAVSFNLSDPGKPAAAHSGLGSVLAMFGAVGLVVAYFGGPVLNFGDFARYGRSMRVIRRAGFWGLPVNFLLFAVLVVVTASLTLPVFGELITDPTQTIARIDDPVAVAVGVLTILVATLGINIVANFVSPAFDFSNVSPQRISWLGGGMIAAVASTLIAPWKLASHPEVIHYVLETLGAFLGALYGVLVADYYLTRRQRIVVDDLYTMSQTGRYWYTGGFHLPAILAAAFGGAGAVACVLLGDAESVGLEALVLTTFARCSWFVGAGLAGVAYWLLTRERAQALARADGRDPGLIGTVV